MKFKKLLSVFLLAFFILVIGVIFVINSPIVVNLAQDALQKIGKEYNFQISLGDVSLEPLKGGVKFSALRVSSKEHKFSADIEEMSVRLSLISILYGNAKVKEISISDSFVKYDFIKTQNENK